MATEEGEDGQCAEKVGLKRKLTGPPRLLLGKTKPENRCEARAKRNKTETTNHETGIDSLKRSDAEVEEQEPAGATSFNLTETVKMDEEVSSEISTEPCRGRSGPDGEDTSEGDDGRNRKPNKRGWWRIFSLAVICVRRQKKDVEKSSVGGASAELLGAEPAFLNNNNAQDAPNVEKVTKGKRRFTVLTWPTFKSFLTSCDVQRRPERRGRVVEEDDLKPSLTFRWKLQRFLSRGRREPSPSLHRENTEDKEDESASPVAQMDDLPEDLSDVPGRRSEVVTVTAEMSGQLPEERAASETTRQSPNLVATEERQILDMEVTEEESEMIQTDSSANTDGDIACAADKDVAVDITTNTNEISTDDVNEVASLEKEEVIESDAEIHNAISVATDANDQLSIWILSSEEASEMTSQPGQPLTSRTADGLAVFPNSLCEISSNPRIKVDPPDPDGVTEEEDGWEASSSMENHHQHHLLHVGHRESQLVQMARSLVQAAMSAAMEQLTREQQSVATSVHGELQGCRDHA